MQNKLAFFFFLSLVLWYSLVFFPIPELLIEGTASLLGPMGILMVLLVLLLAGMVMQWKYVSLAAFPLLAAWGLLQFNAHWRTWIVEASPEQQEHYYQHFRGTWRIFPESAMHTVPDLYHFVLGLLIGINLALVIIQITKLFSMKKRPA
ncbi:MAG: hypothetical protein V2I46_03355 [Bacteroides sp.]|jgi:hypothetical protein|nr:hypothetical protein [Bacteroides sp.]